MIGTKLSPILIEIEDTLWEFEFHNDDTPPCYTDDGARAAFKICMSVMMDKMWILQNKERMSMADREIMAESLGREFRKLIKTYTDVDTRKMYKFEEDEKSFDTPEEAEI